MSTNSPTTRPGSDAASPGAQPGASSGASSDGLATIPVRPVTASEVEAFWRDGVVLLRAILPVEWTTALADPLERAIGRGEAVDMGSLAEQAEADAPAFRAGVDHWRHDETFRAFSLESPLAQIAAELMRSEHVWLWEDSVLVKEAGSPFPTQFHTDDGYFHVTGDQVCTVWVPLDPASPDSGMVRWVQGSHLSPTTYRPNLFVSDEPIPGTEGEVVPDVMGTPALASRLVSFEVEPGDVTVHHSRTLHGAPANASAVRRRAVSVRYCGDDARYRHKPGLTGRPGLDEVADGDPLAPPWCPLAWPR